MKVELFTSLMLVLTFCAPEARGSLRLDCLTSSTSLLLHAVLGSFLATLNVFCEDRYGISHELDEFFAYDFMKVCISCRVDGL